MVRTTITLTCKKTGDVVRAGARCEVKKHFKVGEKVGDSSPVVLMLQWIDSPMSVWYCCDLNDLVIHEH